MSKDAVVSVKLELLWRYNAFIFWMTANDWQCILFLCYCQQLRWKHSKIQLKIWNKNINTIWGKSHMQPFSINMYFKKIIVKNRRFCEECHKESQKLSQNLLNDNGTVHFFKLFENTRFTRFISASVAQGSYSLRTHFEFHCSLYLKSNSAYEAPFSGLRTWKISKISRGHFLTYSTLSFAICVHHFSPPLKAPPLLVMSCFMLSTDLGTDGKNEHNQTCSLCWPLKIRTAPKLNWKTSSQL